MAEPRGPGEPRRLAVIDLGSNSFRLVVFSVAPAGWWRRTDEIFESVRIGAGLAESGRLRGARVKRALQTLETYIHFCRAIGLEPEHVRPLATSAIRDATNRDEFLARARELCGVDVRVLSPEEEAGYGYLAAVNSTTLRDGAVLDLGGGSLQLVSVADRRAGALGSWPVGTVRMTERFLPGEEATRKQLKALRAHVAGELESAGWLSRAGRHLVGLGGRCATSPPPPSARPSFPLSACRASCSTGRRWGR